MIDAVARIEHGGRGDRAIGLEQGYAIARHAVDRP